MKKKGEAGQVVWRMRMDSPGLWHHHQVSIGQVVWRMRMDSPGH